MVEGQIESDDEDFEADTLELMEAAESSGETSYRFQKFEI